MTRDGSTDVFAPGRSVEIRRLEASNSRSRARVLTKLRFELDGTLTPGEIREELRAELTSLDAAIDDLRTELKKGRRFLVLAVGLVGTARILVGVATRRRSR